MTAALPVRYDCPCCGYGGLDQPAYGGFSRLPVPEDAAPPYSRRLGDPSYDVCPCCGFEFGNDDEPGTGAETASFESYRADWIAGGCRWFDERARPANWTPPDDPRAFPEKLW
jgi:hypothetical protein